MASTFFFYDLETSGFNPKSARIMQFAGQRTDLNLKPIGEPVNELIKLTPDVLPDPGAILVTGITPQRTIDDGITEAEFLKLFYEQVALPDTIFVGYNTIRFDDEFMRYLHWRNFYDPYEWHWKNGASRWDLLDVVRLTRALRPDGIKWAKDEHGKPTNRLELLAKANQLDHANAHDALSDVNATIALAKLIKSKQPKLFNYLLNHCDKAAVAELVNGGQPFVYASGKYPSEYEKTTVAIKLADNSASGALVYDLRHDPEEFISLSAEELVNRWQFTKDPDAPPRLPVKTMKFNRCPAIAPLGVLEEGDGWGRIKLNLKTVETNREKLANNPDFIKKIVAALSKLEASRQQQWSGGKSEAESQLYDGFIGDGDKAKLIDARSGTKPDFNDKRLNQLYPRYRARNYPADLSVEERAEWDSYCQGKLLAGGENSPLAEYFKKIAQLKASNLYKNDQFLLEELELYGQSIIPLAD